MSFGTGVQQHQLPLLLDEYYRPSIATFGYPFDGIKLSLILGRMRGCEWEEMGWSVGTRAMLLLLVLLVERGVLCRLASTACW
jgi:hypothetical protein